MWDVLMDDRDGANPYGIVALESSLVAQQEYDVVLCLHVPRSPLNIRTGNFMLVLSLLSSDYTPAAVAPQDILFSSRRPAILRYTSRLISLSERLATLPLYILNLRREDERLDIPMAERLAFSRGGKNVPAHALVEIQAAQELQVYELRLRFTARFKGVRWWMYHHRFFSFGVGVAAFWGVECGFMMVAWVVLGLVVASGEGGDVDGGVGVVKDESETDEEPDLSDTPRTFPTYGRQAALRFEPTDVKKEELDGGEPVVLREMGEADDEDEERGVGDSGLGTSYSEGGGGGVARRRSRGEGRGSWE